MFHKARYTGLEVEKAKTCLGGILEHVSEAYPALEAWENGHSNIYIGLFFSFCNSKEPDTWNGMLVLRTWPTFSLAISPPALSNCEEPAGAGVSRDVSAQSFAGVSQSEWQVLFYHAETSPVRRAVGWNFLLWRPPFCCCVAKGFCRLFYCLNSHQICIIIQAWKKKKRKVKKNLKKPQHIKPALKEKSLHKVLRLLTLTCSKIFWDVLLLSIGKVWTDLFCANSYKY